MSGRLPPAELARSLQHWRLCIDSRLEDLRCLEIDPLSGASQQTAVFMETRQTPMSEFAIRNTQSQLGSGWNLELVVSEGMVEWVQALVSSWGAVRIHPLRIPDRGSPELAIHGLLRSTEFWSRLRGETLFLFDSATFLRRPLPEALLEYDYIGAPWSDRMISPWCRVGNGRCSIRSRAAVLDIIDRCNTRPRIIGQEDVFFSVAMHLSPDRYRLPGVEVAREFAVREMFHPDPVALQEAWKFHSAERLEAILGPPQVEAPEG